MAIFDSSMSRRAPWLSLWAVGLSGILVAAPQQRSSGETAQIKPDANAPKMLQVRYQAGSNVPYGHVNQSNYYTYEHQPQTLPERSRTTQKKAAPPNYYNASSVNYYVPPQQQQWQEYGSEPLPPQPQQQQKRGLSKIFNWGHRSAPQPQQHVSKSSRYTGLTLQGKASWYGRDFHGGKTANGERYDMESMTAAHRTLPFGTQLKVTNLDNGQECVVRVNNRGPFRKGRILDLSKGAARQLGMITRGIANVHVQVLSPDR
jgi:rare lipoprotein A